MLQAGQRCCCAAAWPPAARLAATLHDPALQPPLLVPASSSFPSPATPTGKVHEGSHPSLKLGHVLKEPLPLEASCQCIALWFLNTLLARTQATPSFLTPHPTCAEVVLDMPWLKHLQDAEPPPRLGTELNLVPLGMTLTLHSFHLWQVALHTRGTSPWHHPNAKSLPSEYPHCSQAA